MDKKVYFWNTIGSLLNASLSIVLTIVTSRIMGLYDVGIFSLGYANALLLQHVGSFDSRSYQCSHPRDSITFADYFSFRVITCGLMTMVMALWILLNRYSIDKRTITVIMVLYSLFVNISDIFQGNAQRKERLDLGAKSLSFRVMLNIVVFALIAALTHNIFLACASLSLSTLIWIILFDRRCLTFGSKIKFYFNKETVIFLFKMTFPLFISLFFQMYILNIPKYAIDTYMSVEDQAIFNIIFMPASIINLVSTFIFKPIMVVVAKKWEEKEYHDVLKGVIYRDAFLLIALAFIAAIGAGIGPEILGAIYGYDITNYRFELGVILIGGGFIGISSFMYFMITIIGKQKNMTLIYLIVFIFSYLIGYPLVSAFGIAGASICYLISSIALGLLLFLYFIINARREIKGF